MSVSDLRRILDIVENRTGIVIREAHRQKVAIQLFDDMLTDLNLQSYQQLHRELQKHATNSTLWKAVVQGLTIGETYFYRNGAYVTALSESVIPDLIRRKVAGGERQLRVWSAGSATGEELYSVAMMLRDQITDLHSWDLHLIGTDLNEAFLEKARRGVYRAHSFRKETPDHVQKRWFVPHAAGYQIKPELRDMVTFTRLNLIEDEYPSAANSLHNFDLILCRNVTIYFEPDVTRRVLEQIWASLAPAGWLILGHSETMLIEPPDVQARTFKNAIFYQRQQPSAIPAPVATPKHLSRKRKRSRPVAKTPRPPVVAGRTRTTEDLLRTARQAADAADWDNALDLLNRAEARNNLNPVIYYLRALVYRENGLPDDALAALRKALYCDPNFALAHYALGELYEQTGATKDAMREWMLANQSMMGMLPDAVIDKTDQVTVEMLRGLIDFKLKSNGG